MTRKDQILEILRTSKEPVRGVDLGEKFGVTRQIIVQDIALLRAEGIEIVATNRGYIINKSNNSLRKKIVCKHHTIEEMQEELEIIVDFGGKILDVIIEHPIYGQLIGTLEIGNRMEVKEFINSIKEEGADPLSRVTAGVHLHTVEVEKIEFLEKIEEELLRKGYMLK